jgi:hypothetical protein
MMAISQDQLTAQEDLLRTRLHLSGDTLDVDGIGSRSVRPPAPSSLLLEGRRVRSRHRARIGSALAVAALTVTAAGAGVGTGAFPLPWLRADGTVSPGTLDASGGSRVGDLINALDTNSGVQAMPEARPGESWWGYVSGPNGAGSGSTDPSERIVRASLVKGGTRPEIELTLSTMSGNGGRESARQTLGTLTLGADGRGTWLRVRPSAEDGWLLFALLPPDATLEQFRVAGSDVVLPMEDRAYCLGSTAERYGGQSACPIEGFVMPLVYLRIATTDAQPPFAGITYVKDGGYVVLGPEAQVR